MPTDEIDALFDKIMTLNEYLWEGRATRPAVDTWLDNFTGSCAPLDEERKHALFLLSKFLYFGQAEIRQLLRAMFQDLIRHPLSVQVRSGLKDKTDFDAVHLGFLLELERTRFLGLGNPAESGTHILYDFRTVNQIPVNTFCSLHDLFTGPIDQPGTKWAFPRVHRLIFIDDFCGTGDQASDMGRRYVPSMRDVAVYNNVDIEVWYLTLLATTSGLANIRANNIFDHVESVSELDETYRAFGPDSQIYNRPPHGIQKEEGQAIAFHYGETLDSNGPLGYKDSQLMVGFHHNVPDNTLPIFSQEQTEPPWHAIFPRFAKF